MDSRFDHLELPVANIAAPRRKRPAPVSRPKVDRKRHGSELLDQADDLSKSLVQRQAAAPDGVNPKLIFKLIPQASGGIMVDELASLRLSVIGVDPDHAIVVFPSEESLSEFKSRLSQYAGVTEGHQYEYLGGIAEISELEHEDRLGSRLLQDPIAENEVLALDIELWHTGDISECKENVESIDSFLRSESDLRSLESRLGVTDSYVGTSIVLIRARVDSESLDFLLGGGPFDFVKEIERRPEPAFEFGEIIGVELSDLSVNEVVQSDMVGVVTVDSGIAQLHPLIAPALGDAQVFPDRLKKSISGGPEDGDTITPGHGTAVAGIAAYGDVAQQINSRALTPTSLVFSARVTDGRGEYSEEDLLEHQLESAVSYFVENYSQAKVINISLGNVHGVCHDQKYQFRLAALIDELAYRYRDRELVFVVSAGNYYADQGDDADAVVAKYPGNLIEDGAARIIDPGTSAIALTVGGLASGQGQPFEREHFLSRKSVAGAKDWPSPFTRVGWGFGGAIKPELVDEAGDLLFENGKISRYPRWVGVPSLHRDFGPPEGRLLGTFSGTSFSAPKVANMASQLFQEFPGASSNLIRALLIDSAAVPTARPEQLQGEASSNEVLRIYGYGKPSLDRAISSDESRVLLLRDGNMELDTFEIFEIPPLPEAFLAAEGRGFISVSLAFDPPTRHTRSDNYLGVSMEFKLFRNVRAHEVAESLRAWDRSEKQALGDQAPPSLDTLKANAESAIDCNLMPGTKRRRRGTAQRGLMEIRSPKWNYDYDSLVLAITCRRNWASEDVLSQRYAVVVSIGHEGDGVQLYSTLRQKAKVVERSRSRVRA